REDRGLPVSAAELVGVLPRRDGQGQERQAEREYEQPGEPRHFPSRTEGEKNGRQGRHDQEEKLRRGIEVQAGAEQNARQDGVAAAPREEHPEDEKEPRGPERAHRGAFARETAELEGDRRNRQERARDQAGPAPPEEPPGSRHEKDGRDAAHRGEESQTP